MRTYVLGMIALALLAGCVQETPEPTDDVTTLVKMQLEPVQCQPTPWEEWYSEGNIQFAQTPTPEQIAIPYYEEQDIEIHNLTTIERDEAVCQACDVCPQTRYFEVSVEVDDADALEREGWTRI